MGDHLREHGRCWESESGKGRMPGKGMLTSRLLPWQPAPGTGQNTPTIVPLRSTEAGLFIFHETMGQDVNLLS